MHTPFLNTKAGGRTPPAKCHIREFLPAEIGGRVHGRARYAIAAPRIDLEVQMGARGKARAAGNRDLLASGNVLTNRDEHLGVMQVPRYQTAAMVDRNSDAARAKPASRGNGTVGHAVDGLVRIREVDALVEVAFDNVGKKKLMLKSAGAHMRKL